MRSARAAMCRTRSAAADNSRRCARKPQWRWSSTSDSSTHGCVVLGSGVSRPPCPLMPIVRDLIAGPWRAVLVLGVTEILAWGAIFYPPVLTVPLIAHDRGWSMSFAMGGFSLALLTAGLVSPRVGRLLGRHGGHRVTSIGSLLGALGLALIVYADHPAAYLAVWMMLGVATAATLYDPAFATLGRIFGLGARRPITTLTLAGGFASTVSWPVTHVLLDAVGWQGSYLVYAAVLALVAAPLHAFALPRARGCRGAAQRGGTRAECRPAAARLALRAGGRSVCRLRLRAVRSLRASARNLRPRRHRFGYRGRDRRAVRTGTGRLAHLRTHVRAQHSSASRRALCGRHAAHSFRVARAVRAQRSGRRGVRRDVRNGQWASHHRAGRGTARAVRRRRLRTSHGPHRRPLFGDASDRAAGARVHRGAQLGSDGACRGRELCGDIVHRVCRRAPAEVAGRQGGIALAVSKARKAPSSRMLDLKLCVQPERSYVLAIAAVAETEVAVVDVVLVILLITALVVERPIAAAGAVIARGLAPSDVL